MLHLHHHRRCGREVKGQRSEVRTRRSFLGRHWSLIVSCALVFLCLAVPAHAQVPVTVPAPPTNLQANDAPLDGGEKAVLTWHASADEPASVSQYIVSWRYTDAGLAKVSEKLQDEVTRLTTKVQANPDRKWFKSLLRTAQENLADAQANNWKSADEPVVTAARDEDGSYRFIVEELSPGVEYTVQVRAATSSGAESSPVAATVTTSAQFFDISRSWLVVIVLVLCGSIIAFILIARSGVPIKIRKIAGLEAVDEAVGRATEMGRPILFVPGIQDMNDMMTLAGLTALGHVAKRAAEYDAKLEVPTSRSLVMTAARETVQNAFIAAGRPDAYNQDLIYYVTDEQFGYVAYLSGHMAREKPAACFYLGAFFAESLILAETGNAVGAIQIAGTAETAQLPFFVAACDYTLIGEEFYAASAYLSGEPDQLGSLRGQDIGKTIVAIGLLVGCCIATAASLGGSDSVFNEWLSFLKTTMLR